MISLLKKNEQMPNEEMYKGPTNYVDRLAISR